MARVDIVLATYDGGPFLAEQLDSILAQSHEDWRLIVRDDGSRDDTVAILDRYRQQHPDRITVLTDDDGTLGHAQNFARALAHSDGPYVALSDQDDVWLPDKLRLGLEELRRLERDAGPTTPLLVFSDARVVGADLSPVADSLWSMTGVDPDDASLLGRMLHHNVVSAHTVVMNAALREAALPIPTVVRLIDWWIALVSCSIGRSAFLTEPTVLHRRHELNATNARPRATISWGSGRDYVRNREGKRLERQLRYAQAEALAERVADRVDPASVEVVDAFLALPEIGLVDRVRQARRYHLMPRDLPRSLIFVLTARGWTSDGRASG